MFYQFIIVVTLLLSKTAAAPVQARKAFDFCDSIGINVHLSNDDCCYGWGYETFRDLLVESGIHHVRDGMISGQTIFQRFNELGSLGIKSQHIVGPDMPISTIKNYPSMIPQSFERYEGPNEFDAANVPNWAPVLQNWTRVLWQNHDPAFAVVGPSLTQTASYALLGNLSSYMDYGNMHNYYATVMPETPGWGGTDKFGVYGSLPWALNQERQLSGSKPIITSENGWQSVPKPDARSFVPNDVQSTYLARLLLYQFAKGLAYTYIYEFCDCGGTGDYYWGIVSVEPNTKTQTPRPSYWLIANLLKLLRDNGNSMIPGALDFQLSGQTNTVESVLLQKQNKDFYLALWLAQQPWDPNGHGTGPSDPGAYVSIAPQSVSVTFAQTVAVIRYTFSATTGNMTQEIVTKSGKTVQIFVTETPSVLAITLV